MSMQWQGQPSDTTDVVVSFEKAIPSELTYELVTQFARPALPIQVRSEIANVYFRTNVILRDTLHIEDPGVNSVD